MFSLEIDSATLFIITMTLVYIFLTRNQNYWKKRGVNGPTPLPLIGNILDNFKKSINVVERERYQKYGRIYGYFEFSQQILTIGEPDLIRQIGIRDFNFFQNHFNLFAGDPLFSKILVTLQDDDWKRVRTVVSPTFTPSKIKKMMPMIQKCISNTVQVMDTLANDANEVDFKMIFRAFTLDVIAKCAFAVTTNGHQNEDNEFLRNAAKFLDFSSARIILANFMPITIKKRFGFQIVSEDLLSYFKDAVKLVIKTRKQSGCKHHDFLQLLIDSELNSETISSLNEDESETRILDENQNVDNFENKKWKKHLDESEIIAQCIVFILAGYETTSTLLYYCVYLLAVNPKKQDILFDEICNYFKSHEKLEYESMNELSYLDAVINESLRMFPPLAHFDRVASKDYVLGETGIIIPKGTVINLPFYAMHRDPEFFEDPDSFKPERFLPENSAQIKPHSFLPFGIGPRKCVGMRFALMNAKMFLLHIVFRYEFAKTKNTPKEPIFNSVKILSQCKPLFIRINARNI